MLSGQSMMVRASHWFRGKIVYKSQGFNPVETRGRHRLEAYATLVFWTIERALRAIFGSSAVHPEWRATAA